MDFPDLSDRAFEIVSVPFVYDSQGDWHWRSNHVGHWNLWICLEGLAEIRCDGIKYSVHPWTAFLFSDDSVLEGRSTEGSAHMRNFSMHLSLGAENRRRLRGRLLGIQLYEVDSMNSLINLAIRLSGFNDAFAPQQLRALALDMIGLLWRVSVQPVQADVTWIIYRQLDRIHAGQDMFRSVDELAAEANLSRMHYSRCFRQITGESPNRYLIQKRIDRACVLLKQTDWPVEAVGRSIGYADLYFFSRQFKKITGTTATAFREVGHAAIEESACFGKRAKEERGLRRGDAG